MIKTFKEIDKTKLSTTAFSEYINFKEENPDCIILFQIGDFFETICEDAVLFAEITGVTLGKRKIKDLGEVIQAGIPKASINNYIKKLLSNNIKICLCTQQKNENGEIYRKIERKYTQGTIIENEFLDSYENNFILTIIKNNNDFDIAYADVSTGQFYKTTANKSEIFLEIEKIEPNEILILQKEKEIFKELLQKYNSTILDENFEKYSAKDIILEYCKKTQKNYLVELDEITEYKINKYLVLDNITRRNLELRRTKYNLKKKGSLFWFLNYTKTPMGTRLLKKYLDEPLLDTNLIKERQKAIEELILNKNNILKLEELLDNFSDLSRICAKISNSTIAPKELFQITDSINQLNEIDKLCKIFNSPLLKINPKKLQEALKLINKIKSALSENSSNEIKSGNVINQNYNSNLDFLRAKLSKINEDIENYEHKEKNNLKTEKLKVSYSKILGYYIEIPISSQKLLDDKYIKKQTLSNCVRYTTNELTNFEQEKNNLLYKINELEYELFCEIRKYASNFVEIIRQLAFEISNIDVIFSLAKCAIENNLKKPSFNSNFICAKNALHPSLIKSDFEVTKNDISLSNEEMIILTGANMSGKSTYLKLSAIICLLAQIGSFVPSEEANLTIIDKIFFRQNASDDIINSNSSFMVEMNDLKYIIDNATKNSLILLDEPAKSTNAKEGGAIARAFCEYEIKKIKAKSIVATHNLELTKLEDIYPDNIKNYVIGNMDIENNSIDRKIKRGIIKTSMALNTAILADLPKEIIQKAKELINS